jgi:hypothetical protein
MPDPKPEGVDLSDDMAIAHAAERFGFECLDDPDA